MEASVEASGKRLVILLDPHIKVTKEDYLAVEKENLDLF